MIYMILTSVFFLTTVIFAFLFFVERYVRQHYEETSDKWFEDSQEWMRLYFESDQENLKIKYNKHS